MEQPAEETAANVAAETPAEASKETVSAAAKPAVKAPRVAALDAELAMLLAQLYLNHDFQQMQGCPPDSRILDFWALSAEPAATTQATPEPSPSKPKDKWPPRISLADRPRDYRLHVYLSMIKDPSWGVPGKDVLTICADRASGLLLLMAEQKGFFLPSDRLSDLCEIFAPTPAGVFKITGPKLRKASIARFFSPAGFARELADAHGKGKEPARTH